MLNPQSCFSALLLVGWFLTLFVAPVHGQRAIVNLGKCIFSRGATTTSYKDEQGMMMDGDEDNTVNPKNAPLIYWLALTATGPDSRCSWSVWPGGFGRAAFV